MQIGNGQLRVEPHVLHPVRAPQGCQPIVDWPQLRQDVVVDVHLEPEDLTFLQHRLAPRVVAPRLAFLITASTPSYLLGEATPSDALLGARLLRSGTLRWLPAGLSAIN